MNFVDGRGQQLYPNLPKQQFANGFLAWSLDGRRIAAVSVPAAAAPSIWIVDPEAREPFKKLADLPVSVHRPIGITWTPDGSAVIIGKQEAISDIVLFDVTR